MHDAILLLSGLGLGILIGKRVANANAINAIDKILQSQFRERHQKSYPGPLPRFENNSNCSTCIVQRKTVRMKGAACGPTTAFEDGYYTYVYLIRITPIGLRQWKWPLNQKYNAALILANDIGSEW